MPDSRLSALATRIRELGDGATPGPWGVAPWDDQSVLPQLWCEDELPTDERGKFALLAATEKADASFIAAFNPQVATALAELIDGIVGKHRVTRWPNGDPVVGALCLGCNRVAPCPDIRRLDPLCDLFGIPSAGEETGD